MKDQLEIQSTQSETGPLVESTYRLQFHKNFTFRDAAALVDYLGELGITHAYASPYLKSRAGSTHGYDVIDPCSLNPEIGAPADYDAWIAALRQRGMGHILDIVPNHLGVATNENHWWNDVLENGIHSPYHTYFDITWEGSPTPELHHKVLLPVLGEPYAKVLEKGDLKLSFADGAFSVNYYDRRFPLSPATYSIILRHRLHENAGPLQDAPARAQLVALFSLEDGQEIKRGLANLTAANHAVGAFIKQNVQRFNGTPGDFASFDLLDNLLNRQFYRLAYWRVASDQINYRRFFDINDLAALAMEHQQVFDATHRLILDLLHQGKVDGLRVDHSDGLFDPQQYLHRLHSRGADYVVVEKILGPEEPLPTDWQTAGTTGYDFLAKVNALFVDGSAEPAFTRLYADWINDPTPYEQWVYVNKKRVLQGPLASELNMLAHRVDRFAQARRRWRDFTLNGLRQALCEVIACFPVYRSYVSPRGVSETDRQNLRQAIALASGRNPKIDSSLFAFLGQLLISPQYEGAMPIIGKFQQLTAPVTAKGIEDTTFYTYNRLVCLNEVGGDPGRFGETPNFLHQYFQDRAARYPTALSPLSTHDTKRSEDVRARLSVLSEMPDQWQQALTRWSELNAAARTAAAGNAEGEAGRAGQGGQAGQAGQGGQGGQGGIDRNEEYLLYQTLLGGWPLGETEVGEAFGQRIQAYLLKAMREAKQHSSWIDQNEPHEKAVRAFIAAILDPRQSGEFLADFLPFQQQLAQWGMFNSLAQTLLRLTAPGVADTYQGTELWDFSLVDPDNRRPVDYSHRHAMLRELKQQAVAAGDDRRALLQQLLQSKQDGRIKLYLTWMGLTARRQWPGLFTCGTYQPLRFEGDRRDHLFGFARSHGNQTAITIIPRLLSKLIPRPPCPPCPPCPTAAPIGMEVWQNEKVFLPPLAPLSPLPPASSSTVWRDILSGAVISASGEQPIDVGSLLDPLPLAFLIAE